LLGIFTDGDLRRTLDFGYNVHQTTINQVMSQKPKTVKANELAINALDLMQRHKISGLLVVDDRHHLIGALHMHDLLRAGL
jgi:arabinose-5-phosphate isomerase